MGRARDIKQGREGRAKCALGQFWHPPRRQRNTDFLFYFCLFFPCPLPPSEKLPNFIFTISHLKHVLENVWVASNWKQEREIRNEKRLDPKSIASSNQFCKKSSMKSLLINQLYLEGSTAEMKNPDWTGNIWSPILNKFWVVWKSFVGC